MMPDGADPCAGYTRLREVIEGQGLSMQAMSAKISELAIKLNEARAEIGQLRQEPRDVTSISMMSAGGYR
jgi:hypothetical protein